MEFFNAASVVLKYFIQVNIIVTFCIILVFAVRFLVRKYSRLFSCCAWGIVGFGLVLYRFSPAVSFPRDLFFSVGKVRAELYADI